MIPSVRPFSRYFATAIAIVLLLGAQPVQSGEPVLKRRTFMGAHLQPPPPGTADPIKLLRILPGGIAESAGAQAGDTVLEINGSSTANMAELSDAMQRVRHGDPMTIKLGRDGKVIEKKIDAPSLPFETSPDFEISYEELDLGDRTIRLIISKPRGDGPFPAMLYLSGLTCASMDFPLGPNPVRDFVYDLTGAGIVVVRPEKPGVGDGNGPPCGDIDFKTEADSFLRALEDIKKRPYIDASKVFLFGHSMGGVVAPVVAAQETVRGVCVYGTTVKSWLEYDLENTRYQTRLAGASYSETEKSVGLAAEFDSLLYQQGMTLKEIRESSPRMAQYMAELGAEETRFFSRDESFWRQMVDVPLASLWEEVDTKVLSLYGEADFVSRKEDHQLLADIVNSTHPGNGKCLTVPQADHIFNTYATDLASLQAGMGKSEYNPAVAQTIISWMEEVTATEKNSE